MIDSIYRQNSSPGGIQRTSSESGRGCNVCPTMSDIPKEIDAGATEFLGLAVHTGAMESRLPIGNMKKIHVESITMARVH